MTIEALDIRCDIDQRIPILTEAKRLFNYIIVTKKNKKKTFQLKFENLLFAYARKKIKISCAVTLQLISVFDLATKLV